eukprot:8097581-Pyramimonas_sp.AAC.1
MDGPPSTRVFQRPRGGRQECPDKAQGRPMKARGRPAERPQWYRQAARNHSASGQRCCVVAGSEEQGA